VFSSGTGIVLDKSDKEYVPILILSPSQSHPLSLSLENGRFLWLVRLLGTHSQHLFATFQTVEFSNAMPS